MKDQSQQLNERYNLKPGWAYRIPKWKEKHETYEGARRKVQQLSWVQMPTDQASPGLVHMINMGLDGVAAFGFYVLLVEYAGTLTPPRGVLATSSKPLSIREIATFLRMPVEDAAKHMQTLMIDEIGWVDQVPWTPVTRETPHANHDEPRTTITPELPSALPTPAPQIATETPKPTLRAGNPIYDRLEQRLGRQLFLHELRRLADLLTRLESDPVIVADKQVPSDEVVLTCIPLVKADARAPVEYLATIIDDARQKHLLPSPVSGPGSAAKPRVSTKDIAAALNSGRVTMCNGKPVPKGKWGFNDKGLYLNDVLYMSTKDTEESRWA